MPRSGDDEIRDQTDRDQSLAIRLIILSWFIEALTGYHCGGTDLVFGEADRASHVPIVWYRLNKRRLLAGLHTAT